MMNAISRISAAAGPDAASPDAASPGTASPDTAPSPDEAATTRLLGLRGRPVAFLSSYVRRRPGAHAAILLVVMAAVLCSVGTQYGIKALVDAVSAPHARAPAGIHAAWAAFALLCGLIAADNALWRVGGLIAAYLFPRVTADARADLFAHVARHSPAWHADRLPGSLSSRVTAVSNAVFTAETLGAWNVLPPVIAVVCADLLIASVSVAMALALAGIAVVLVIGIFALARRGAPRHHAFATAAAAVDGELVDVFSNIGVVRAFGGLARERRRVAGIVGAEVSARTRSMLYLERVRVVHAVTTALLIASLVGWGMTLWQSGAASAGDLILITTLGLTVLNGTRDLAVALVDLTQHVARLGEATQTLLAGHAIIDTPDARPIATGPGRIVFDGVTFGYPGRPPVLRDFSLTIEAGQRVGLVGASGAGKSTVLALLQRFHDIQGGKILIDGQDVSRATQDSLHRMLAVVPQDLCLFHRSVLENVRYARPDASEEEVLDAIALAQCGDVIAALPDGFETMVGERGAKLSGGQRQRLAIARAALKSSPVLLLDEATSALDGHSEAAIQAALTRLMRGRTVVAIAHRLSTLANFDRIVVMEDGRVIDDGAPDALAARPGPYRELLRAQGRAHAIA